MNNSLQFPSLEVEVLIGPRDRPQHVRKCWGDVSGQRGWCHGLQPSLHAVQHSPLAHYLLENRVVVGRFGGATQQITTSAKSRPASQWSVMVMACTPWYDEMRRCTPPLWSSPQNLSPHSNHGKNTRQARIGDILQNTWPEPLKTVKVMKKTQGRTELLMTSRDPEVKRSKCNCSFLVQFLEQKEDSRGKLEECR